MPEERPEDLPDICPNCLEQLPPENQSRPELRGRGQWEYEPEAQFARSLLEAQSQAQNVAATRSSSGLNYRYASTSDIIGQLKATLVAQALTLNFSWHEYSDIETETARKKVQWLTTVRGTAYLTHAPTGLTKAFPALGRSLNESDKGIYHAVQQAKKVFMLGLLLVDTDVDAEPVAPEEVTRSRGDARRPTQAPEAAPAPVSPPSERIPAADGVAFKRDDVHGWLREDTGEFLQTCGNCGSPMLVLAAGHTCVKASCGNVVQVEEIPNTAGITPKEKIRRCHETLKSFYAKNQVEPYHPVAVVNMTDGMEHPNTEWSAETWELYTAMVMKNPAIFERSAQAMAGQEPAEHHRIQALRDMVKHWDVKGRDRVRTETAIASGWAYAVEEAIAEIELKHDGPDQGGLGV